MWGSIEVQVDWEKSGIVDCEELHRFSMEESLLQWSFTGSRHNLFRLEKGWEQVALVCVCNNFSLKGCNSRSWKRRCWCSILCEDCMYTRRFEHYVMGSWSIKVVGDLCSFLETEMTVFPWLNWYDVCDPIFSSCCVREFCVGLVRLSSNISHEECLWSCDWIPYSKHWSCFLSSSKENPFATDPWGYRHQCF